MGHQEDEDGARLRLRQRIFAGAALGLAAPGVLFHRAPVPGNSVQIEAADAVLVVAAVAVAVDALR